MGLLLHKPLGHRVHLLCSVLLHQLAAAAVPLIKQTDQVVGLVEVVVGLVPLLLLVALETLHLFRQVKGATVAGIAEAILLHILLVVEVAQAQWVEVVLVLLVERVEQVRHHLFLVAASLMLVAAVDQMATAGHWVRVAQAVGLRGPLVPEPMERQILEAVHHQGQMQQAAQAALAS